MVRGQDANFVMGRVAGLVLGPRMMAAHPLLGVGWGNYPLVRDDPQYRRGTAFALQSTDSPSLGPIDYIVELGFPLFLYLTWAELKTFVPAVETSGQYMDSQYGCDADPRKLVWGASKFDLSVGSGWTGIGHGFCKGAIGRSATADNSCMSDLAQGSSSEQAPTPGSSQ